MCVVFLLGRELIQVSGVANMPSKAVGVWSSMGGGCISTSSGSFLGHTSAGGGGGGQLAGCIGDTEPGGVQTGASGEELIPAQEYMPVKHNRKCVAVCRKSLKDNMLYKEFKTRLTQCYPSTVRWIWRRRFRSVGNVVFIAVSLIRGH